MFIKKRASLWDYAFAVGKIRTLERFLIHDEAFKDALEEDLSEALKLFVESDLYSEDLLHVNSTQLLEEVLNAELNKVKKLISQLILDKELLVFLDSNDLSQILAVCKKVKSKFLYDYTRHMIDMDNIKTYLRLYILKEQQEELKKKLLSNGFLTKEDFLQCYSKELSFFLNKLNCVHKYYSIVNYNYFLGEAIRKLDEEKSFVYLDKAVNEFLIEILKPAKYISFGPEPIIAYYFAKVNEINFIRLISLTKLTGLGNDLAKLRLGKVYG